jgi:threo-3-hydroxy-L-aspartate ammonia-lyase
VASRPSDDDERPPDAADVLAAAGRLRGVAHRTPVLRSRLLDEACGATVFLKAECLQRAGAFKFRGAYNHMAALEPEQRSRGVLTTSSGNHAQAVALAGALLGIEVTVLMPHDAPAGKLAATRAYGAEVVGFDRYREQRDELTARHAAEHGLHVVHAYDHRLTMAGQGTAALELFEDAGDLDALLVCVGGGGLLAGCATVAAAWSPGCRVIGVEPAARPALARALQAGEPVRLEVAPTLADGQQTDSVGPHTLQAILPVVERAVGVSDDELVATMRFVFERLKVVLEPSGASALAALLHGRVPGLQGRRVGVTLSGGNIEARRFAALIEAAEG